MFLLCTDLLNTYYYKNNLFYSIVIRSYMLTNVKYTVNTKMGAATKDDLFTTNLLEAINYNTKGIEDYRLLIFNMVL